MIAPDNVVNMTIMEEELLTDPLHSYTMIKNTAKINQMNIQRDTLHFKTPGAMSM